jgi:hypothetical protein
MMIPTVKYKTYPTQLSHRPLRPGQQSSFVNQQKHPRQTPEDASGESTNAAKKKNAISQILPEQHLLVSSFLRGTPHQPLLRPAHAQLHSSETPATSPCATLIPSLHLSSIPWFQACSSLPAEPPHHLTHRPPAAFFLPTQPHQPTSVLHRLVFPSGRCHPSAPPSPLRSASAFAVTASPRKKRLANHDVIILFDCFLQWGRTGTIPAQTHGLSFNFSRFFFRRVKKKKSQWDDAGNTRPLGRRDGRTNNNNHHHHRTSNHQRPPGGPTQLPHLLKQPKLAWLELTSATGHSDRRCAKCILLCKSGSTKAERGTPYGVKSQSMKWMGLIHMALASSRVYV